MLAVTLAGRDEEERGDAPSRHSRSSPDMLSLVLVSLGM